MIPLNVLNMVCFFFWLDLDPVKKKGAKPNCGYLGDDVGGVGAGGANGAGGACCWWCW